jgi:hypothetical protein
VCKINIYCGVSDCVYYYCIQNIQLQTAWSNKNQAWTSKKMQWSHLEYLALQKGSWYPLSWSWTLPPSLGVLIMCSTIVRYTWMAIGCEQMIRNKKSIIVHDGYNSIHCQGHKQFYNKRSIIVRGRYNSIHNQGHEQVIYNERSVPVHDGYNSVHH